MLHVNAPNSRTSQYQVDSKAVAALWSSSNPKNAVDSSRPSRRLKVGVLSSDFGIHPVSSLVRGVLDLIDRNTVELFAFALKSDMSWWGLNVSGEVEHFVPLHSLSNTQDAASAIAATGVEILIDLNGHTKDSGLPIMSHRPAPVQMSFLGYPTITGAKFVDYYVGDFVALPPEHADHFTEKLVLMQPCYISNDYAQLRGNLITEPRHPSSNLKADFSLRDASFVLGTLSNFMKLDPFIFQVWMNIMHRFPCSKFVMIEYSGHEVARHHVRNNSMALGIPQSRLAFAPQAAWNEHLQVKTAFDMLFDSPSKNGHTTGLDAMWAGVPLVTIAGGATMSTRASESIAAAMDTDVMLSYSLKEYEDIAISLLKDRRALARVRGHFERRRRTSYLFDTPRWTTSFTRLMQSTWEAVHVSNSQLQKSDIIRSLTGGLKTAKLSRDERQSALCKYNVFSETRKETARELALGDVENETSSVIKKTDSPKHHPVVMKKREVAVSAETATSTSDSKSKPPERHESKSYAPIPDYVFKQDHILLNIGKCTFTRPLHFVY